MPAFSPTRHPLATLVGAACLALLSACGGGDNVTSPTSSVQATPQQAATQSLASAAPTALPTSHSTWAPYDPQATYPKTRTVDGLYLTMPDGVQLAAKATFPADASGVVVPGRFPVILTQTSYNKNVPIINDGNTYLVQRGYVHVFVDVRGTGNSGGAWDAFGAKEQGDYREVMNWASTQPWSDGRVGTYGASLLAITQLFTAAKQHPAHKAMFTIVPMADAYRDIVFSGGQTNIGFIPLWLGLVTALGVLPTHPQDNPALAFQAVASHLVSALTNFQVPTLLKAVTGDPNTVYDGPFSRDRSPVEVLDRVQIPTFIVGGLHDIFQRGEPLLFEKLKNKVPAKLMIGPWTHIEGSLGLGLPRDGVPTLDQMALQWFDRHVKGQANGMEQQPNVTQYHRGIERYVTAQDWPHPQAVAQRFYLQAGGGLATSAPTQAAAPTPLPQFPLNGLCSQSTVQWTAGVLTGGTLGATNPQLYEAFKDVTLPCARDNRLNELLLEKTFTTAVMAQDMAINGPIEADIYASTTSRNAGLSVRVTDVAPDGSSREITNGVLTYSFRAVDDTNPTTLRLADAQGQPQRLRPWHPFTQASLQPVTPGQPMLLPVEIFPSSFVIRKGHKLRIAVGPSDFPHGLPPLPDLVASLGGLTQIYADPARPSSIVVPVVPTP